MNEVLFALKRTTEGFTITELVVETGLSRSSVRTQLAYLEGAKKIKYRRVGMAKIYTVK